MNTNFIKRTNGKKSKEVYPPVKRSCKKQCHFCFKKFEVAPTCQKRFCSEECKAKYQEARKEK